MFLVRLLTLVRIQSDQIGDEGDEYSQIWRYETAASFVSALHKKFCSLRRDADFNRRT